MKPATFAIPMLSRPQHTASSPAIAAASMLLAFLAACGGGGGGDKGTGPGGGGEHGSIAVATSSAQLIIAQGGSANTTITITRTSPFTGAVTMAVSGAPSGVTASLSPASIDAASTSSTLTVAVGAAAALGTATLTVTASGSGVTQQTTTVQLTVIAPSIGITVAPTALSIGAGQNGSATVTITRSSGFTAPVSLALLGNPTGVTGTFTPSTVTGNSATLSLATAASTTPGQYTLTVRGSATGVTAVNATLTLNVTASGPVGFTLGLDPATVEMSPGQNAITGFVNVTRGSYSGPISVTVSGVSGPVVIAASPSPITGNASNLLLLVPAGTALGTYTATIKASAPGFADQTSTFTMNVVAPTTGSIHWRICAPDRVPLYFAVRDGDGAWKHVVPDGNTYSFNIGNSKASMAMINLGEHTTASPLIEGFNNHVFYGSTAELTALANADCDLFPDFSTVRTANGTATNISIVSFANISMGRVVTSVAPTVGATQANYTLINLLPGPHDLIGVKNSVSSPGGVLSVAVEKLIVKRNQNPANAGLLPVMDFNAAEAVAPATATATIENALGESFAVVSSIHTANGTFNNFDLNFFNTPTLTRPLYGLPATLLQGDDLHQFTAITSSTTTTRTVTTYVSAAANTTLTFGPVLPAPSASSVAGGVSGLLRMQGTLPTDYAASAVVFFKEAGPDPRGWTVSATRGWLGGTTDFNFQIPDLSALTGYTKAWNIRAGAQTNWTFTAGSGIAGVVTPANLTTYRTGTAKGSIVP